MTSQKKEYQRAELAQIILDEMYQLVGILDVNGVNLESNQTSLDAAGIKREEVIGKYFWDTPWWPDSLREKLKSAVQKAATGEFVRFEIENKVKDGTIYVDFSLKPVKNAEGRVQFIIPEGRDITLRKKAEDELEKAYTLLKKQEKELRIAHAKSEKALLLTEERLKLATETAQLGFWDLDLETRILFCDPTALAMFDIPQESFSGEIETVYERIHESDREKVEQKFEEAIKEGTIFNVEHRVNWRDGSIHYILGKGRSVYSTNGQPSRFIGVTLDVTEKKMTELSLETRFRELADSMPQIVFVNSKDGTPLYFNEKWFTYTGFKTAPANVEGWAKAVHPDDYQSFKSKIEYLAEHKVRLWELAFRLKRKDGVYRWHLGRAVAAFNEKQEVIRWYATFTDIDDQKKSQLELSKAVHVRDEFLSIASHELKTPLTSLKLQLEMQERRLGNTKSESELKATKMSSKQVDRIARLIDDMLDVSRITSGKMAIKVEECSLNEIVKEVDARLNAQAEAAKCKVTLNFIEEVRGYWDRFRLEQVVTNLYTNAIKYGQGGPVTILVNRKNDHAILSIKDKGLGISLENQSRIFGQFERAANKNEISGLGLGLYICQQIVELHKGSIRVESELGKGANFIVELPLQSLKTNSSYKQ